MSSLHEWEIDRVGDMRFILGMSKRPFHYIGVRLTAVREALGITQAEVCRAINVQPNRWNQYESGDRRITIEVALKLREKFRVTTDWIYAGDPSGLPGRIFQHISTAAQ